MRTGPHTIQTTVKVYLQLDDHGQWAVDPISVDGEPLDEPQGLHPVCAEYGSVCQDEVCQALVESIEQLPLPSGRELFDLLSDALAAGGGS